MRAWSDSEDALTPDGETPRPGDPETLAELEARGVDLAPGAPGLHRHGEVEHAHDHPHPHLASTPDGRPVLGIVGGGPVGLALAVAFERSGWPLGAVATRDPGRRERFRGLLPGVRAFAEAAAILDEVHLVVLAVPDDAIAALAGSLHLYSGQAMVHTSGAHGAEILAPAMAAGTEAGSFHPLVAFADVERAVADLRGATVAVDGDEGLLPVLAEMAESIGGIPVRLPAGSKPAYHAAAVLAAGGLVALLDAIAELGRAAGLDEAAALAVYEPLMRQTIANARALGIRDALTGPIARGDIGTVAIHIATLERLAPGALELYRSLARREVLLAQGRGTLTPQAADAVLTRLAMGG